MQKKLTISIDESIYIRLHQLVGRGKISKFIETKITPFLTETSLAQAYKETSEDGSRTKEAEIWDVTHTDGFENFQSEDIDEWL
ncbi:MAG: hypothetical protein ACE5FU_03235 [Nitrospinota bacterium]